MSEIDGEKVLDREKIEVPEWMDDREWTVQEIRDLNYGGCASGCYMPAVTHHEAGVTMAEHGDAVLDYLEDYIDEMPRIDRGDSWQGFAVKVLSMAVETWARDVEDRIDGGDDVFPDDDDEIGADE